MTGLKALIKMVLAATTEPTEPTKGVSMTAMVIRGNKLGSKGLGGTRDSDPNGHSRSNVNAGRTYCDDHGGRTINPDHHLEDGNLVDLHRTLVDRLLRPLAKWRHYCRVNKIDPICHPRVPSIERCCTKWVKKTDQKYQDYRAYMKHEGDHWVPKTNEDRRKIVMLGWDEYKSTNEICHKWRPENDDEFWYFTQNFYNFYVDEEAENLKIENYQGYGGSISRACGVGARGPGEIVTSLILLHVGFFLVLEQLRVFMRRRKRWPELLDLSFEVVEL